MAVFSDLHINFAGGQITFDGTELVISDVDLTWTTDCGGSIGNVTDNRPDKVHCCTGFFVEEAQAVGTSTGSSAEEGLSVANTTAAAAGAQQFSSVIVLKGFGWKTDATAASQEVEVFQQVRPVQGAAAPTGSLHWSSSIAGAAIVELMDISSAGDLTLPSTSGLISSAGAKAISTATGTSAGKGLTVDNTTPATVGAQQFSPVIHLKSEGWGTGAGASETVEWFIQGRPVQSANPEAHLHFSASVDGGAVTDYIEISDVGPSLRFNNSAQIGVSGAGGPSVIWMANTGALFLGASGTTVEFDRTTNLSGMGAHGGVINEIAGDSTVLWHFNRTDGDGNIANRIGWTVGGTPDAGAKVVSVGYTDVTPTYQELLHVRGDGVTVMNTARVAADVGGAASTISFSNVTAAPDTGTTTLASPPTGIAVGQNTWVKIYVGTVVHYLPSWTA